MMNQPEKIRARKRRIADVPASTTDCDFDPIDQTAPSITITDTLYLPRPFGTALLRLCPEPAGAIVPCRAAGAAVSASQPPCAQDMVTKAGGFSPAGLNRSGRIAPGSWVVSERGKHQVAPWPWAASFA
jgi:hypothetical protein